MRKIVVFGSCVFLSIFLAISCIEDAFDMPSKECSRKAINPSLTILQLKENVSQKKDISSEDVVVGYVTSSDENSNFYKQIFIQDDTAGLSISVDDYNLYTHFEVGRQVALILKNLKVEIEYGQLKVNGEESITKTQYESIIPRMCGFKSEEDLSNNFKIKDINDSLLGQLITLDSVQFTSDAVGNTLYNLENNVGGATNYLLEDEEGFNIIVRTSSFADFANNKIPEGSGRIRGVLTKYRSDYQLVLRGYQDISFSQSRKQWQTISIAALRKKEQDKPFAEARYIKGIVTLSGYTGSKENNRVISDRHAVLQDNTGGIALYFDADKHTLEEGDSIKVYLGGHNLDTYAGLLRLETLDFDGKTTNGSKILEILSKKNPMPQAKKATISEVLEGEYQSEYVSIDDVQFVSENRGLAFKGDKSVTNCKDILNVYTRSACLFSNESIPDGKGTIFGIMSASSNIDLLLRASDGAEGLTNNRCTEAGTLFFEEDFETFNADTNISKNGWQTLSENSGNKLWEVGSYGENKYAQASAYKSGVSDMIIWLVSPAINLDKTTGEYLTFKTKDGYNNGNPLTVFISNDFDGSDGSDVSSATWEPVSTKVSNHTEYGYAPLFTGSGEIDISRFSGDINIGFKYTGSDSGITTTIQIDEIHIFGKSITP